MDSLQSSFTQARLPLELRVVPLGFGGGTDADDIVQMDIFRPAPGRGRGRPERFRIYPGHEDNRLEVLDADAGSRQLVLRVDEAARAYRVWRRRAWESHFTDGRERTFLLGMDEAHLFIALLPEAAGTVAGAHAALKPAIVAQAERRGAGVTRQGEWFFIALSRAEEAWVSDLARRVLRVSRSIGIAEGIGLRRVGQPHVAAELVVVRSLPDPYGDRSDRAYVRGAVTHPDHRPVVFDRWRKVVPNTEQIEAPPIGVDWID